MAHVTCLVKSEALFVDSNVVQFWHILAFSTWGRIYYNVNIRNIYYRNYILEVSRQLLFSERYMNST